MLLYVLQFLNGSYYVTNILCNYALLKCQTQLQNNVKSDKTFSQKLLMYDCQNQLYIFHH